VLNEESVIPPTEEQKKKFMEESYLTNVKSTIDNLKKKVVEINNTRIEYEIKLENNKEKYTKYADLVISLISHIRENETATTENDEIINILYTKLNNYAVELEIDVLKKKVDSTNMDYLCIKELFFDLSGFLPSTTCNICLENQVNYFIDPCGHTLCTNCKEKNPRLSNCHFCRTKITGLKRLYL
jgi:hypothetical protein